MVTLINEERFFCSKSNMMDRWTQRSGRSGELSSWLPLNVEVNNEILRKIGVAHAHLLLNNRDLSKQKLLATRIRQQKLLPGTSYYSEQNLRIVALLNSDKCQSMIRVGVAGNFIY